MIFKIYVAFILMSIPVIIIGKSIINAQHKCTLLEIPKEDLKRMKDRTAFVRYVITYDPNIVIKKFLVCI